MNIQRACILALYVEWSFCERAVRRSDRLQGWWTRERGSDRLSSGRTDDCDRKLLEVLERESCVEAFGRLPSRTHPPACLNL